MIDKEINPLIVGGMNMKKNILLLFFLIIATDVSQAQLATDSWAFGFGLTYPRFVSVNIQPLNSNYGGFLSLKRNFSEHVGLRLNASYSHLEGEYLDVTLTQVKSFTNVIAGNLDLLYYLFPCKPISPYLFASAGSGLRMLKNNATASLGTNEIVLAFSLGGGVEWAIDSDWKILAEYGYHITTNSELDGAIGAGEINGRDTYFSINLGLLYYFKKGEPSKDCQLYSGKSQ